MKRLTLILIALALGLAYAGCGGDDKDKNYSKVEERAKGFKPYLPKNDVEFKNYNAAQELYDSPTTIIWCSTTWANPSSPIVTVPIAGKLTSSSTTFFSPEYHADDETDSSGVVLPKRSVDGLYHPNPPQYRYGFTPGGQYVDFFNMPTFCTTALTKLQRQQTELSLSLDAEALSAQRRAEDLLRKGDKAGAQRALEAVGE